MAISSIGASPSSTAALQNAGLGQEDFLKLLLTQLQFQDPLKPMDNQEFIAQMAQFTSLELNRQQNDKADTLMTIQSATQALTLIGKQVEVTTETRQVIGEAIAVRFPGGEPAMTVRLQNGEVLLDVRLSQISLVST
jgi:flagellar basal-body rod modification protein FlgD